MRILHVVPSFPPALRYGGPVRAADDMTQALAARGHDVAVFTTDTDGPTARLRVPVGEPVRRGRVDVTYFRARPPHRYTWSPQLARALQREVGRFDVVHVHSVLNHPTTSAARAARRAGVPYVVRPAGMLSGTALRRVYEGVGGFASRARKAAYLRVVERGNLDAAAALHYTTPAEERDAKHLGLRTPAFVEPLGVAAPPPAPPAPWPAGTRAVVYVGRLDPIKGLDALVPALGRILPSRPDVRFVLAGAGDPAYEARVASLLDASGILARTDRLGFVDGDAKAALLAHAAAFVLPSRHENFGLAAAEALAAGAPVVLTPEVGLAPWVEDARSGLVVPREPAALAAALAKLLDEPAEAKAMGERGRRLAAERFAWPAIAARLEARYERILKEASA